MEGAVWGVDLWRPIVTTHFHGTVPKAQKLVLEKESETASEKSASEDEVCTSTENAEAARAKNAAGLPANALANANNGDECSAANANASKVVSNEMDANVSNIDMTGDLIDFTDGTVELADCDASEVFDNGDCFDVRHSQRQRCWLGQHLH